MEIGDHLRPAGKPVNFSSPCPRLPPCRHPPRPLIPAVPSHQRGLRTVALLEALKGGIVLVAGFGLLSFLGRDAELLAELEARDDLLDVG